MKLCCAVFAALCLLLAPAAARAESYASDELKFSADFPETPTVSAPIDSERDAQDHIISRVISVTVGKQRTFMAAVFCDTFSVTKTLDVDGTLNLERDNFVNGLPAAITSSHTELVNGHRAMYFTYAAANHGAAGQGVVIIVETEKPQIYLVETMYTRQASDSEKAALETFFASFRLNQ
ncbi:MAG: hypothetical protein HY243_15890 [Proteobacteria bacterium]|nr:hypothetical protein [Pseudomonadota bacterium]